MSDKILKIKVFRYDPETDKKPYYALYDVPLEEGMSAMNALDYIYQYLDSTIAYFDHAGCDLGICGRCTGKINGKPGLFCQAPLEGDATLSPVSESRVLKDLVVSKGEKSVSKQ